MIAVTAIFLQVYLVNSRTKKKSKKYDLDDLRYLMRRLRDPETGCPWDLKQTFQTIAPFTLEEVFEVVDTIEREDYAHLKEELGDLLFQVIFYAQLGEEEARFNFDDIVSGLVEKLVLRHPHVFPAGTLHSYREGGDMQKPSAIKETWEAIKQSERKEKGREKVVQGKRLDPRKAKPKYHTQKRPYSLADLRAKQMQELEDMMDDMRGKIRKKKSRGMGLW